MNRTTSPKPARSMDLLFSMLLLFVFLLCSVFTILIGSRVYENIRSRNDRAFYSDTALGYITNKVHQADSAGSVSVLSLDGCSVLALAGEIGGTVYETWIYTKDGALKELFSERGSGLTVEDGLDVMECGPVYFSIEQTEGGTLLLISLQDSETARLFLRSAGEPAAEKPQTAMLTAGKPAAEEPPDGEPGTASGEGGL